VVIVPLRGGLGNQMFQYAFGRYLSVVRNDTLVLNTENLPLAATPRHFGLNMFQIVGECLESNVILERLHNSILYTITEIGFGQFDVSALEKEALNIAAIGYWQSEKYFRNISSLIRAEFTFKPDLQFDELESPLNEILNTESVCVHVRRSDVLKDGDPMGELGIDYYKRAVRLVLERVCNPNFFVFSDDIEWCKENLDLGISLNFISDNDFEISTYSDFYLMSHCRHFIIANSTYSWWGAWLGRSAHKLIIAPRGWFLAERLGPTSKTSATDDLSSGCLIPSEWIRI